MQTRTNLYLPLVFLGIFLVRTVPCVALYMLKGDAAFNTVEPDPLLYLSGARSILESGVNEFPFFPPLNFLFIAGLLYLGNGSVLAPVLATACIGWLAVVVLYVLARELFGETTAFVTALLAGCYPNFIFFGMNLYPETLAVFFIVCSFLFLVAYFKTEHLHYAVFAGILWGLASQTRGGLHFFSLGIAGAIVWHAGKRDWVRCFKPVCAVLFSTYCVVFAVSALASPFYGGMSLNSKSGMGSVLHGANRIINCNPDYGHVQGSLFYQVYESGEPWPEGSQVYSDELLGQGSFAIMKTFVAFVLDDPLRYLKSGVERMSFLWSPNQLVIRFIKLTLSYHAPGLADVLCFAVSTGFALLLCASVFGLLAARNFFRPLFLLFLVFYCLLVFFTVGNVKLRFPLMPFILMYAAYFFVMFTSRTLTLRRFPSACAGLVCCLVLFNGVIRYRDIILSPAEFKVRQVETCIELGFPETAGFLLEKNKRFPHYTEHQRMRLDMIERRLNEGEGE